MRHGCCRSFPTSHAGKERSVAECKHVVVEHPGYLSGAQSRGTDGRGDQEQETEEAETWAAGALPLAQAIGKRVKSENMRGTTGECDIDDRKFGPEAGQSCKCTHKEIAADMSAKIDVGEIWEMGRYISHANTLDDRKMYEQVIVNRRREIAKCINHPPRPRQSLRR